MNDVTQIIKALAWPITISIIFIILRTELQRLTKNVADRIQNATSVSLGPRGFEMKGMVKAVPIPPDVQIRKVAVTKFIRGLTNKNLLDDIADNLFIPRSTALRAQISDIILEINRRVQNKQDMDTLASVLKPIIGQSF